MKNKVISTVLIGVLGLVGCATKTTVKGVTTVTPNSAIVVTRDVATFVEPFVATATQFACSTALSYITDVSEKQSVANQIYVIATTVSVLANGNLPDVDKITSIMKVYSSGSANLAKYSNLINSVNGVYQTAFSKNTNSDSKLIIQIFGDMATGAAAGAKQAVPTIGQIGQ